MKYLKVIISFFFLISPLYSAETIDTSKASDWNDPWGGANKPNVIQASCLRCDLVVKKSKERLYCKILKEHENDLEVLVSRNGELKDTVAIARGDIEYFEYDHVDGSLSDGGAADGNFANPNILGEPTLIGALGFLQAGGIVGFDLERKLFDHVGFQLGAGIVGADAALNIHLGKSIRSPYISLQARNQLLFTFGWGIAYGHRFENGWAFQAGIMGHAETRSLDGVYIKPKTAQMFLVSIGKWFRL